MLFKFRPLLLITMCMLTSCVEPDDTALIQRLMEKQPDQFADLIREKDKYEIQVIYTQIDRDENNRPTFTRHYFNVDSARYFYPASTVKMPMAFLAMEYLNQQPADIHTPMFTDSSFSGQTSVLHDSSAQNLVPTAGNYIRKIFLVSDNDAFNRLYEYVGMERTNAELETKGFPNSRIIHRLSIALSEEENRHTNPVNFIQEGDTVWKEPAKFYSGPLPSSGTILKGKGYLKGDSLMNQPMDFSTKNFMPLEDLTDMLASVVFPDELNLFNLSEEDYTFLLTAMSQLPGESRYPAYDRQEYFDTYCKFLLYGSEPGVNIPANIRIFNKIGLAYGYTTDAAYVIDTENKVEFMLSATIHTNENQIYNDGIYEYDSVAFPFMRDLGRLIYNHELERDRPVTPDLSRFENLDYE